MPGLITFTANSYSSSYSSSYFAQDDSSDVNLGKASFKAAAPFTETEERLTSREVKFFKLANSNKPSSFILVSDIFREVKEPMVLI